MSHHAASLALLALTLAAGCSSVDKLREEPDTSPRNPTAVMEVKVVSHGIKGLVPYEGTTRTWTRSDMQREDSTVKGTGTFTRFVVGTTDDARIVRLDRKLVWDLEPKEKRYTECPLKGCVVPAVERPPEKKPAEPRKAEPKASEPDCRLKIANASFTVKPSGEKKAINGFDTEQYQVAWLVTLADQAAKKSNSTLVVNVWTTPYTQPLKDAMAVESAYAKGFANALAGIIARDEKTRVVPEEAQRMIEGYLSRYMTPADRAAFLKAGRELEKIKGYPVLTELTWNVTGDACANVETARSSPEAGGTSSVPTSVGGAVSSVASWFARKKSDEKAQEIADAAILSFSVEVKAHSVQSIQDSTFLPPRGYQLANPRQ